MLCLAEVVRFRTIFELDDAAPTGATPVLGSDIAMNTYCACLILFYREYWLYIRPYGTAVIDFGLANLKIGRIFMFE